MSKYSLSKSERLKHQKDIEALFATGKSLYKFPFNLRYHIVAGQTEHPVKFSVSVPKKKIKLAVGRNKVKRQIREYYRLNKHLLIDVAKANACGINLMFIYANNDISNCQNKANVVIKLMQKLVDAEFN